jgi:glucans biosynthesis protein C
MSGRLQDCCGHRQAGRLIFIDALRVAIVAFVVVHHAAQAYGPTGGFWPVHDHAQSDWVNPFYTVNAAFGMGLLFLVAGYFTDASLERKGLERFLRERWARIGVPLITLVLLVQLPAVYLIGAPPTPVTFIRYLYEHGWLPIYLHLWFLAHLLLYSAAFAAWREAIVSAARARWWSAPGHATISGFVLALALVTWIVRLRYPVDKWVPLLWIMPAEPAHMPQYVALFATGITAHRGDWFRNMPTSTGVLWLGIGAFRGVFFRPSRLLAITAAASFGAYILHPPIVVALQVMMQGFAIPALLKFPIVSLLGIVLAFAAAHWASNVPGVRAMLGRRGADNLRALD